MFVFFTVALFYMLNHSCFFFQQFFLLCVIVRFFNAAEAF